MAGGATKQILRTRERGVTLIELLIAMVILGVALSLVGPLTMQQLDNMYRAQERETLQRTIQQVQFKALQTRSSYELVAQGPKIEIYRVQQAFLTGNRPQQEPLLTHEITFEYLRFDSQVQVVNGHGFWSESLLTWREGEDFQRERFVCLLQQGQVSDVC